MQTSGRLVTQKQMYLRRSFRVSLYNERILCNFMIQNFNSNTIHWFFFFKIPMGASIPKQSSGNYKDMSNIWGKSTRNASPFWLSCAGPAPRPQHEHTGRARTQVPGVPAPPTSWTTCTSQQSQGSPLQRKEQNKIQPRNANLFWKQE